MVNGVSVSPTVDWLPTSHPALARIAAEKIDGR